MTIEINWALVIGVAMFAIGLLGGALQLLKNGLPRLLSPRPSTIFVEDPEAGTPHELVESVAPQVKWVKEVCDVSKSIPAEKTLEFLQAGYTRTQAMEAVIAYLTESKA